MAETKVCLCGGMSGPAPAEFFDADIEAFVASLEPNTVILYGGVTTGLVGRVASVATRRNLPLEGALIPEEENFRHPVLRRQHHFLHYDERQSFMFNAVSTIYFLPGGLGTFHEVFDALLRNKGNPHPKRLILINWQRFWDPVKTLLQQAKDDGFLMQQDISSLETWEGST